MTPHFLYYVGGRIAKISDMEASVAASKDDATLWETEEQALRYLLEDGKLNLCLRNMVEFKTHQRQCFLSNESPAVCYIDSSYVCLSINVFTVSYV